MLHTEKAVITEGRYDKARLTTVIDGLIITTEGFGIFNSKEKQTLIKKIADEKKYREQQKQRRLAMEKERQKKLAEKKKQESQSDRKYS